MSLAYHSGLVMPDGTVYTAGYNFYGELGTSRNIGAITANPSFTQVTGLANVKQLSCGFSHSAILLNDGTVYVAGMNQYGQLGIASNSGTSNPTQVFTIVPGFTNVKQVSCGYYHTVLVLGDGTVYVAGSNQFGQLGIPQNVGTTTANSTFTQVTGITTAIQAGTGQSHTAILLKDGTVYTAGKNNSGQLGISTNSGTTNANPSFSLVTGVSNVKNLACGYGHTVLLFKDGTVSAAGFNWYGQLGNTVNNGTNNANPVFTQISGISNVNQVSCGQSHTALVLKDGSLYTAGSNQYGQLGLATNSGTANPNPTFTKVSMASPVKQVACGYDHTALTLQDGTAYTAGHNYYGQLGYTTNSGTDTANPTFTLVTTPASAKSLWDVPQMYPYYLIKDGNNNLLAYSGSTWNTVGSFPADLTQATYENNGMDSVPTLALASLPLQTGNSVLMLTDNTSSTPNLKFTGVPKPTLLTFSAPIDVTSIYRLKSISATTSASGTGVVGLIFSVDNGASWKSLGNVPIDITDPSDIRAKCTQSSSLTSVTTTQLATLVGTASSLLIGVYLELQASTDTASIDTLGYGFDQAVAGSTNFNYTMKLNGSQVISSTYSSSKLEIDETLSHVELQDGTNTVQFDIVNDLGDTATLSFNIVKEANMRTHVDRVFKAYSGGFKKQDIQFSDTNTAVAKWDTTALVQPISKLGSGELLSYPFSRKTKKITFNW